MKGNEIMNYEEFSPEAKQAIDHLRNFLKTNKNKIEKMPYCDCCTSFVDNGYTVNIWGLTQQTAMSFNVSFEESRNVAEFCKMKNYWLD